MKKGILFALLLLTTSISFAQEIVAQEELTQEEIKQKDKGEMKFEKTRHNFGVFAQDTATLTYDFVFKNVGKSPLVIHSAVASCGCTVPEYTLEPIMPGCHGKISVTYNGKGRKPGVFRKSITIHNNGKQTPVRLYIEGEMIDNTPPALIQESELYQGAF